MIRKLVRSILKKIGTHPDRTLTPLDKEEEPYVIRDAELPTNMMASTSSEDVTVGIHPDLHLDFNPPDQTDVETLETDLCEIDFTVIVKQLRPGEHSASGISDGPASMVEPSERRELDIDLSVIQFERPVVEEEFSDLDALGLAVPLEELRQEESASEGNADEVDSHGSYEHNNLSDIDWKFELAWASGEEWTEQSADVSSETFDFDITDLEASAEDATPSDEAATIKERSLDGAAANLVLSLGAFRSSDRRALFRRFRAVVEEFQHPASHTALHRLLTEGYSLEEIEEAAHLRCFWRDQPWLWANKRVAFSAYNVRRSPSQRLAFGWPTAIHLVRTFGLVKSERAMVEEWFDDWAKLRFAKSFSPEEKTSFFTYAGYLRQLTPAIFMENFEGVREETADSQTLLELRAPGGALIWKFENKLPLREGGISLDMPRARNHRNFEETALKSRFGLSELRALAPAKMTKTGFCRRYSFPDQTFDGGCEARAQVSSLLCHGVARIVCLDQTANHITLSVPHDQKRLLEVEIALISDPPSSQPSLAEEESSDEQSGKKKKKVRKI